MLNQNPRHSDDQAFSPLSLPHTFSYTTPYPDPSCIPSRQNRLKGALIDHSIYSVIFAFWMVGTWHSSQKSVFDMVCEKALISWAAYSLTRLALSATEAQHKILRKARWFVERPRAFLIQNFLIPSRTLHEDAFALLDRLYKSNPVMQFFFNLTLSIHHRFLDGLTYVFGANTSSYIAVTIAIAFNLLWACGVYLLALPTNSRFTASSLLFVANVSAAKRTGFILYREMTKPQSPSRKRVLSEEHTYSPSPLSTADRFSPEIYEAPINRTRSRSLGGQAIGR